MASGKCCIIQHLGVVNTRLCYTIQTIHTLSHNTLAFLNITDTTVYPTKYKLECCFVYIHTAPHFALNFKG